MQSVIFKVESQFHQYRRPKPVLLSRLLPAPICDCLGKPEEQSHTVIPKPVLRKVEKMQMHKRKGNHTDNKNIERNSDQ